MKPSFVLITLLAQLAWIVSPSSAQTYAAPDTAGARAMLESPQLARKAWGAYSAAQLRDPGLSETVIGQLRWAERFRGSPAGSEGHALVQALLDSLIQLRAEVPLDAVLPFADRWRAEAFILLARRPPDAADEGALLTIRGQDLNEAEWLAVNNLLLRIRSKVLLRNTLEEVRITHTFVVGYGVGEGAGGSFGRGVGARPSCPRGFPEIGVYQLEIDQVGGWSSDPEDLLAVPGPFSGGAWRVNGDVLYRRIAVPAGETVNVPSQNFRNTDRQAYRRAYLAELGGIPAAEADRLFCPTTQISWGPNVDLVAEAESKLNAQREAIAGFVAEAARKNGLFDLTGRRLVINPVVKDRRSEPDVPLPYLRPVEVAAY